MSDYTYNVVGFTASFGSFSVELQKILDEYAQGGWRVVQVIAGVAGSAHHSVVLEKAA